MDIKKRQFIINTLRRASMRWKPRNNAKYKARTEQKINPKTGRLCWHSKCNICKQEFLEKELEIDHILPVIPISGFDSWEGVLERMFCDEEGFQIICEKDHDIKTLAEGQVRKKKRKKKKK